MQLYDPQQHRGHAALYGRDPGVDCHAYAALTLGLWLPGPSAGPHAHGADPGRAAGVSPQSGVGLAFTAWLHQFHRAGRLTQERSAAIVLRMSIAFLRYRRWEVSYTAGHAPCREKEHQG